MHELILLCVVAFAFIMIYFANSLANNTEQTILKVIMFGFVVYSLILIGKIAIDSSVECFPLVNQTITNGDNTTLTYTDYCYESPNTTHLTFYKVTLWFTRIFMFYLFGYFIWIIYKWIMEYMKNR